MQQTHRLLYKSFLGRSVDELKRRSSIAWNLEAVKGPSGPYLLHDFRNPKSVSDCKLMSDEEIGGFSTAELDWVPAPEAPSASQQSRHGHARFRGTISDKLPFDKPDIKRSGYAAWRTEDRPPTIFGRSLWDIDPYTYLAMRVKSDGRSYFINVQTESVVPTDLHQHRLFAKRPGEWETILVKWNDFVRTNHGFVVEPQTEILRQRIKSVGIGLTDRIPGPFELCIERVWATNDSSEGDVAEAPTPPKESKEGELKDKHGKSISWSNS